MLALRAGERPAPNRFPIGTGHVHDPAVAFEESVRNLEERKHQAAIRRVSAVATAGRTPDELAGLALDARVGSALVDQVPLEHPGLLDEHMFVIRQLGAG